MLGIDEDALDYLSKLKRKIDRLVTVDQSSRRIEIADKKNTYPEWSFIEGAHADPHNLIAELGDKFDLVIVNPTRLLSQDALMLFSRIRGLLKDNGNLLTHADVSQGDAYAAFKKILGIINSESMNSAGNVAVFSRPFIDKHPATNQIEDLKRDADFIRGATNEQVKALLGRTLLKASKYGFPLPVFEQRFLSMLDQAPITYEPTSAEPAFSSSELVEITPWEDRESLLQWIETRPYIDRGSSFVYPLPAFYSLRELHSSGYDLTRVRSFQGTDGVSYVIKRVISDNEIRISSILNRMAVPTPTHSGTIIIGLNRYEVFVEKANHVTLSTARRWVINFGLDSKTFENATKVELGKYQDIFSKFDMLPEAFQDRNILIEWDYKENTPVLGSLCFIDFEDVIHP